MNVTRMKWISTLLATLFIGAFEFIRHQFLHFISMDWGNLLVAALAGVLFFLYFHGIFAFLGKIYKKLQKEQEETAVLQERYRIARELHDSVSQALFFMNIKAIEIENALKEQRQPFLEVKELKEALKLTDSDVRQHIFALQKVTLDNINLVEAIEEYTAACTKKNNITVTVTTEGEINNRLTANEKKQLLHIFKELLVNIRKHAKADQISVQLCSDEQEFSLQICDNGNGFDIQKAKENKSSFGYKLVEQAIHEIGADLKLHSSPGQGTTILICLDLKKEK